MFGVIVLFYLGIDSMIVLFLYECEYRNVIGL